MNERLSPNLMECKSQIVEIMLEQIEEMEANIQRAQKGDLKVKIFTVKTFFYHNIFDLAWKRDPFYAKAVRKSSKRCILTILAANFCCI